MQEEAGNLSSEEVIELYKAGKSLWEIGLITDKKIAYIVLVKAGLIKPNEHLNRRTVPSDKVMRAAFKRANTLGITNNELAKKWGVTANTVSAHKLRLGFSTSQNSIRMRGTKTPLKSLGLKLAAKDVANLEYIKTAGKFHGHVAPVKAALALLAAFIRVKNHKEVE